MEKKNRKIVLIVLSIIVAVIIIPLISTILMNFINESRVNNYKEYSETQQKEIDEIKNNKEILFKINDIFVNKYGYIKGTYIDSSTTILQIKGITISPYQEQMESSLFQDLVILYDSLENNELLNKVSEIDITDLDNIKIYMDSESKTILIGNFENLNTKFKYAKNIMQQEQGKKGEIIVEDIEKAYFRESL